MNETVQAFPLQWPLGYKRNLPGQRIFSNFKQTPEKAQLFVRKEIERLGAGHLIISTNVPVRKDGYLYNDMMREKLDDPGAAIFCQVAGEQVSMCCDQYRTVWENLYALGKSIEAIRAIERYGSSEFLRRVFTGFKELPEQTTGRPWWEVLGVHRSASAEEIRQAYLTKIKTAHPDAGGANEEFITIQSAYKQATNA